MKEILLSQGFRAKVDDYRYEELSKFCWFVWIPKSCGGRLKYAVRKVRKPDGRYTKILMHRQIMKALPGEEIDHWDTDGLNNVDRNLRRPKTLGCRH
jgi:hypothetical protein